MHPPHLFTLKELVSTDELVPPSIGTKTNFITVPYLSGSYLNIIEVIGDVYIFQERLIVFYIILFYLSFCLLSWLVYILTRL